MKPKTIVIGLGRSGIGAAKLLNKEGDEVIVIDSSENDILLKSSQDLEKQAIKVETAKPLELSTFKPWIEELSLIVISPSIPWDHPTLNELRSLGVMVKGEMDIAWERLNSIPWIGVTGTNGKSTVTHLINHILNTNKLLAPMGGNVGNAATEIALEIIEKRQTPDWLVMELSSYQLEAAPQISPRIGLWTNLTPDHLERHGNMAKYGSIKRRLLEQSDIPIYNADDSYLRSLRSNLKEGIWVSTEGNFSSKSPSDYWIDDAGMVIERKKSLFHISSLNMPGKHNLENLLMATAASRAAGLSPQCIQESLVSFPGVPHRLEKIGTWMGINIFNDSKATNYDSASMALKAIEGPIIVLAGGQVKQGNASNWLHQLHKKACGVILFGSGANDLKNMLQASNFQGQIFCDKTLKEAVGLAITISKSKKPRSILLSPACASFDQFQDFEERGNYFRDLITPLLDETN